MFRYITKLVIFLFFFSNDCNSQLSSKDKWHEYEQLYKKGKITEAQYLDSIHNSAYNYIAQGYFFTAKELTEKLALYRKIAWSSDYYKREKYNYFLFFVNNAKLCGKGGEAIYYAEKAETEYLKFNNTKSHLVLANRLYFYNQSKNFNKTIEAYKAESQSIDSILSLIAKGKISFTDGNNYILILGEVGSAYINIMDTTGILKVINLFEKINATLNAPLSKTPNLGKIINDFNLFCTQYQYYSLSRKDYTTSYVYLNKMKAMLDNKYNDRDDINFILSNKVTELTLEYYIKKGNADSARKYLEIYKNIEGGTEEQENQVLLYTAEIYEIVNDYKNGYTSLMDVIKLRNRRISSLTDEMDNLLYAYTDSEFNKEQLAQSEQEKQRRMILFLITLLALIVVLFIAYFIYQKTKKRLNKTIDDANRNTNLKIATLENAKTAAIKTEQEKIAQELHDNFSASLAGATHSLDALIEESGNEDTGMKLKELKKQIHQLYLHSRNKSHQIFYESRLNLTETFSASVISLTNTIFHSKYKKNVDIDADALQSFSYDDKINILRIIQEASINIIKHSKANEISISLFKNASSVILEICDNGVGFKKSVINGDREMGLGLKSILKRAQLLNGRLNLSNDEGAVITIIIN